MDEPAVLRNPGQLRLASERWRSAGMGVALVPTMGALHQGHRSLIRRARAEADRVVVSIFVNPAQFGAGEDLDRYPRPLEADLGVCAAEGVDAVFAPSAADVYPHGFATGVSVAGPLGASLESASRPGHLAGVAIIVVKLIAAARPDLVCFGQKDAQQLAMVRRLVADLDLGTRVVGCPVVRDDDGLALSSRNAFLSPAERSAALAIPRALAAAVASRAGGEHSTRALLDRLLADLDAAVGVSVDYAACVDDESFEPVTDVDSRSRIVVAARIGATRLIDTLCPGLDPAPAVATQPSPGAAASHRASGEGAVSCSAPS